MSVLSALRGAGRQLSTSTAALSALRGARRQLSTSTASLSALRGAGRRQLYTSTIGPSETGSMVFRIKKYTEVKNKLAVGQDLRSQPFFVGGKLWRILCCPNGSSDKYAGFLSVFLEYAHHGSTTAKVQMSIVPNEYSKPTYSKSKEEYRFSGHGDTWGWNDFISHEDLEGRPEQKQITSNSKDTSLDWWTNAIVKCQDLMAVKHLRNDSLIFRCEVTVTEPCLTH